MPKQEKYFNVTVFTNDKEQRCIGRVLSDTDNATANKLCANVGSILYQLGVNAYATVTESDC